MMRQSDDAPELAPAVSTEDAPGAGNGGADLGLRLRRIEGQIRGIARMIDEDRTCEDVITQLLAVRAGMDRVTSEIVRLHVDRCLRDMPRERAGDEVARIVTLLNKIS
jgi:CsoR family transcriptional regulator, copper-sensing transcriptional repressor